MNVYVEIILYLYHNYFFVGLRYVYKLSCSYLEIVMSNYDVSYAGLNKIYILLGTRYICYEDTHIKVRFLAKCLLVKMFRAARKYLISFVEVMHTCLCLTDGKFYIWDKRYWMFAKQRNQKDGKNTWQFGDTKFEILSIALNFSIL